MKNNILDRVIKKYTEENYLINKVNKGYVHNKWIISFANEKKLFLKEFKGISYNRIEFINYIQRNMKEFSPQIIKNQENMDYSDIDDLKYIAYEFIDGEKLEKTEMSNEDIYEIGKFMGKMHKKMKEISIPNKFTEITSLNIGKNNFDKMNRLLQEYKTINDINYIEIIKYKMDTIKEISEVSVERAKERLTKQIVHGDFYLDNLMKKDNKLVITDLDQVCVFYKMYEVIRGAMMIAFDKNKKDDENIKSIASFFLRISK